MQTLLNRVRLDRRGFGHTSEKVKTGSQDLP